MNKLSHHIVWKLLTYPQTVYPPSESVSEGGYMVHDFYRGQMMSTYATFFISVLQIQIEQLTTVKIFHRYKDNTCERAIEVRIQV